MAKTWLPVRALGVTGIFVMLFGCDDPGRQAPEAPAKPTQGPADAPQAPPGEAPSELDSPEGPDQRWVVQIAVAENVQPLLAHARSLVKPLPGQRIVKIDGAGYALLAGPPQVRAEASATLHTATAVLAKVAGGTKPEMKPCAGQCPLWQALAVSPSFYAFDPIDLPESADELIAKTLSEHGDLALRRVPYFDPNDNNGHTEGFVARVDLVGPTGTEALVALCNGAGGSISPDGALAAVECVADYVADTPRFATQVYQVATRTKVADYAPCRDTRWEDDRTLVCMGDFVTERGEPVAEPKVAGRHSVP